MDERAALDLVSGVVDAAGNDAAVVGDTAITIDMLHETTDFPEGTTRYTAGWRSVGASLSDVAAMGANATAAVAVYGAPEFEEAELSAFITGATDVCEAVGAEYVGGDLDGHSEFTVATAAIGDVTQSVDRCSASPGEVLAVTGTLGRSAAAVELFENGETERANDLFCFEPRVASGRALAAYATTMIDSSDGLSRSLHQVANASDCGFDIERDQIPVDTNVRETADDPLDTALTFGEDFELVVTLSADDVRAAREATPVSLSIIGTVTENDVTLDGETLPDRGWTH